MACKTSPALLFLLALALALACTDSSEEGEVAPATATVAVTPPATPLQVPTPTATPAPTARPSPAPTATPAPTPAVCTHPAAADCIRAVYTGAPGDYAQVVDIPADLLLTADRDGRYRVERGQQYTVVTAAPLPEGWTRFYLEQALIETPSPVSASQLVAPVGTTYTFTVAEDETASTLITFELKQARPFIRPRPDGNPEIGDVVVTTVFSVATSSPRYSSYDTTGAVATAGSYAFLANPADTTSAVSTYEALRDGTTTALLIHKSDAHGASQAALYDAAEAGDLFEWRYADDCFVRYTVTEVKADPASAVPRKLLAVEWMTYAFTGCSGAVSAAAVATVDWGELPDLGGTSLSAPVVHGVYQLVPAGWTGAVEAHEQHSQVPANHPAYEGPSWIENPTLAQAQALPYWRTPTLPTGWTLGRVSYGTVDDPPFGYTAEYVTPEGYIALKITGYYKASTRWPAEATLNGGEAVVETRAIAGRAAVIRYSPPSPDQSPTYPAVLWIFDPSARAQYRIIGNRPAALLVEIAEGLFAGE